MKIFYLPDLGEGLAEAEIREWYVKEGDEVQVDQPLLSMETAKAVVDVPSPYAGRISKLHGKINEIIKTGAPLISYEIANVDHPAQAKHSVVGSLEESSHSWQETVSPTKSTTTTQTAQSSKALPAARALAKELQLNLATIKGSGPDGIITVADIKNHLGQVRNETFSVNMQALPGELQELHGVRRAMAHTMTLSHREVVPVSIFEEVELSPTLSKGDLTSHIILSLVAASKAEPALNAWYDAKSLTRKLFKQLNLGLAVDTEEGLFVPVLKDVQNKSLMELRQEINEVKQKVKARQVAASDMQGATITLSNFGMIAGKFATPIVVPPTVAIVGCGRMRQVPAIKDNKIQITTILPVSLSFDHRVVTGGEATRFLASMIANLANI